MNGRLYPQVAAGDTLAELAIDISTTDVIAGALASRDYSPLHHDYNYVTDEAGHRDIFLNTPHQASLFERFLNDWSGPLGRLGRMRFKMHSPVYAGDAIRLSGEVLDKTIDGRGCGWLRLRLLISAGDTVATECEARYALPLETGDNPWSRQGEDWQP